MLKSSANNAHNKNKSPTGVQSGARAGFWLKVQRISSSALAQVTSVFSYTRGKSSAATFLMVVNAPVELPITSRFVFDVLSIITN